MRILMEVKSVNDPFVTAHETTLEAFLAHDDGIDAEEREEIRRNLVEHGKARVLGNVGIYADLTLLSTS